MVAVEVADVVVVVAELVVVVSVVAAVEVLFKVDLVVTELTLVLVDKDEEDELVVVGVVVRSPYRQHIRGQNWFASCARSRLSDAQS